MASHPRAAFPHAAPASGSDRVVPMPTPQRPATKGVADPRSARRTLTYLTFALIVANACGAIDVFVFLMYIVPTPDVADANLDRLNLIVFAAGGLLSLTACTAWSSRRGRPMKEWLFSGRPPTERERDATLRLPLDLTQMSAVMWIGAAVVFSALNAPFSPTLGAEVGLGILMGGVTTCTTTYLLAERILRPITTEALATGAPERPVLPGVAARMIVAAGAGPGVALVGVVLVGVAALAGSQMSSDRLALTVLVLALFALGAGAFALVAVARAVATPVESVRSAMLRVQSGDLTTEVTVNDGSEVGLLQAGFNRMVDDLRDRERLRDLFGRHVGEAVARQALERGLRLGGEVRHSAVLFVDVIGSTTLAATRPPEDVVATLNRFFSVVVDVVSSHGGWVNKFEGDAALCVFGAPTEHPDAAGAALAAARVLDERLRREVSGVKAAIGVSAGPVVAGNIGAAERFEYTVIGDPVNEAARLTELAKSSPTRLLASQAAVRQARPTEADRWDVDGAVTLRGRPEPTRTARPR
jgi:adenylate cyclase